MRGMRWVVAAGGLVLILGCSGVIDALDVEPVPPPAATWVGQWEGPGLVIAITPAGLVAIDQQGSSSTHVQAPAKGWEEGIVVGVGSFTTTWRVDERPYELDGVWHMVVEGVPLVRTGPPPEELTQAFEGLVPAPAGELPALPEAEADPTPGDESDAP